MSRVPHRGSGYLCYKATLNQLKEEKIKRIFKSLLPYQPKEVRSALQTALRVKRFKSLQLSKICQRQGPSS